MLPCFPCGEDILPRAESGRPKSVGCRRRRAAQCFPPRPGRLCPGSPAAAAAPAPPRVPFHSRRAVVFFQSENNIFLLKKKNLTFSTFKIFI
jgi:hypothetical protein